MGTQDKTGKKKKKASVKNTGTKKTYIVKKKNSKKGVEVGKRAVDSAKTKTGAFKPMKWKGTKVTSKGRTASYKDQSGKVHKSTNKAGGRKLDAKYAYDRKTFVRDSTSKAKTTKRFAKATRKGSK